MDHRGTTAVAGRAIALGLTIAVLFAGLAVGPASSSPGRLSSAIVDLGDRAETGHAAESSRRWTEGARIVFLVNATDAPTGAVEAIEGAARTWAATGLGVEIEYGGQAEARGFGADLVNVVSWIETPDPADTFVARTSLYWYHDRPGEIIGFDLAFNLDHAFAIGEAPEAWDIETVALHEFGHVLGLGHADADRVLQVMRPGIGAGEVDHTLSLGDLGALRLLYGQPVPSPTTGFFGLGDAGSGGSAPPLVKTGLFGSPTAAQAPAADGGGPASRGLFS